MKDIPVMGEPGSYGALLRDFLDRLAEEIVTIFDLVNEGGCGIVAAEVGERLTKILCKDVMAVTEYAVGTKPPDYNLVRSRRPKGESPLEAVTRALGDFNHVRLSYVFQNRRYLFDVPSGVLAWGGLSWMSKSRFGKGGLSIPELRILTGCRAHQGLWNPAFRKSGDRRALRCLIARRFREHFALKHDLGNNHAR